MEYRIHPSHCGCPNCAPPLVGERAFMHSGWLQTAVIFAMVIAITVWAISR